MGYFIVNITNLLNENHKHYYKDITIYDISNNGKKIEIKLKPNENYFLNTNFLDGNLKRLVALKYLMISFIDNKNQIIKSLSNNKNQIEKPLIYKNLKEAEPIKIINNLNLKKIDNIIYKPKIKRSGKLVSVVIVNYNCEDYIERAINSVLTQTYKNIELLVIDDNSTDNSINIANKFLNDDRLSIYKCNVNMGPYWGKNSIIQKCNGDYITMLDSDDYDLNNKIQEQVNIFDKYKDIYLVSCAYKRNNEEPSLGYPSMMWRKEVFETIGYYDYTRFGADSEFYDRFNKVYNNKKKHISKVLQLGIRREQGLTSIYPEISKIRKKYIEQYTKWHQDSNNLYIEFPLINRKFDIPNEMKINKQVPFYFIDKINPNDGILPVIMCVWKRVDGFEKVIKQLNNQEYKNFKLFIWNNNPDLTQSFDNILKSAEFDYELYNSTENIGGFGRFYYASKIRRKPGFMDYCVFIDDDQTFSKELLTTFINEREPKTIKSQWGWKFTDLEYYKGRLNVKPGDAIHYAGTGGMIADMRVFEDELLYSCKKEYWFVEDLWLSFFANKYHDYKLVKSSAVVKNGDDEHSLYKVVLNTKTPMLKYLINNLKWDILNKKDLTIIIPTFDNTEYIDQCIQSIKNNIDSNIDIQILIGIDNCEKTKNQINNNLVYNNIESYYFNVNVGPYIIKNTLVKYAKSDNILFFDSDDYFVNNSIQSILDGFKNNEYINFKYQNVKNGKPTNSKLEYGEGVFAIKKDLFIKQNGFYPWRCAADSEFKDRYRTKNNNIYKIDKLTFYRRIHDTSLTKSKETGYGSNIRLSYAKKIQENKQNNYPNPVVLFVENDHYKL